LQAGEKFVAREWGDANRDFHQRRQHIGAIPSVQPFVCVGIVKAEVQRDDAFGENFAGRLFGLRFIGQQAGERPDGAH
jgi:hypothetical protein